MRQSTIITLGASAAFGVLAVILARGWINDAIQDEYARRSSSPDAAVQMSAPVNSVPVVVVTADLGFGDVLTPDMLKVVDFPEDAIPMGTYETMNSIFVDPSKPTIVLRRIAKHEAVLDYKISGPGARGSLSALINDGMRAVSIRVTDFSGVSGFVMPGDYVDVIYTRDEESRRNGNSLESDLLLQNIKVLGIDQDLNDTSDVPVIVRTVTIEVSNQDAQKLHLAQDAGKLSLTLRRAGDTSTEKTITIKQDSILGTPQKVVRYVPRPASTKAVKAEDSRRAEVTIIRGESRDQVKVIKETDAEDNNDQTDSLAGG